METCPNCKQYFLPTIFAKDGGSLQCIFCNTIYHHCKNNTIKLGSPGPRFCRICTIQTDIECPKCKKWFFYLGEPKVDKLNICSHCSASYIFINTNGEVKFLNI